jgi:site-specific DNA-methyltransferase (adenine-specific)
MPAPENPEKNKLYYGDNLTVLRDYIPDASVDLIYLDPPFNSRQDYNVLFAEKDGSRSASQITAFKDSWEWNLEAERSYIEVVEAGGRVADAMRAFRTLLGGSDMLAYLAMMAPRLIELRRVLKETGSIYLHCDPTASHYLKLLLDSVFGAEMFHSEIIWKRNSAHSDAKRFGAVHDTILFYSRGSDPFWATQYQAYDPDYVEQYYRYKEPDGRRFMSGDISAAGLQGGGYNYDWKGIARIWRVPQSTMERLDAEGRVFYTRNGIPRFKRYLDESKGMPAQDVWNDIESLKSWMAERLGYPTQKPEALLERILRASSREGDMVLDPFCGCGTTVQVAQKLNRRWIGVDITHLAIGLIKKRLSDSFGEEIRSTYETIGTPTDLAGAVQLAADNKAQFQYWALDLCDAAPSEGIKKGADRGIDGRKFFHDERGKSKQILFSVKGGQNIGVADIRDLGHVINREQAEIGVYLCLAEPTKPMLKEAAEAGFYKSPAGGSYPRLQILSISDLLLRNKAIQYPALLDATFRKAPRFRPPPQENLTLSLQHDGPEGEDE